MLARGLALRTFSSHADRGAHRLVFQTDVPKTGSTRPSRYLKMDRRWGGPLAPPTSHLKVGGFGPLTPHLTDPHKLAVNSTTHATPQSTVELTDKLLRVPNGGGKGIPHNLPSRRRSSTLLESPKVTRRARHTLFWFVARTLNVSIG